MPGSNNDKYNAHSTSHNTLQAINLAATLLFFPVITLAPSEQNPINSYKFKPKLFSNTFFTHKKINKASADVVLDCPKISLVLTNFNTVIPFSIS